MKLFFAIGFLAGMMAPRTALGAVTSSPLESGTSSNPRTLLRGGDTQYHRIRALADTLTATTQETSSECKHVSTGIYDCDCRGLASRTDIEECLAAVDNSPHCGAGGRRTVCDISQLIAGEDPSIEAKKRKCRWVKGKGLICEFGWFGFPSNNL